MEKKRNFEICKYCFAYVKSLTDHEHRCWSNPKVKSYSFKSLGKRFIVRSSNLKNTIDPPDVSWVTVYTNYGVFAMLTDDAFFLLKKDILVRVARRTFRAKVFTNEVAELTQKAYDAGIRVKQQS